jgi:hypothetical protein
MAISFTIESNHPILKVKTTGEDENMQQVIDYGMALIEATILSNCTHVLWDETGLKYKLGTFDMYESAKFISEQAPGVAMVAIVCNPNQVDDADFWKTVAVNCGLKVKIFLTKEEALDWLNK